MDVKNRDMIGQRGRQVPCQIKVTKGQDCLEETIILTLQKHKVGFLVKFSKETW